MDTSAQLEPKLILLKRTLVAILILQIALPVQRLSASQAPAASVAASSSSSMENWHAEFDSEAHTLVLWTDSKAFSMPVSPEVTRIAMDADTVYFFRPRSRGVDVISKNDLKTIQSSGSKVGTVGTRFLSLDGELPAGTPLDFAAYSNGQVTTLMVSMPSSNGTANIYPVVLSKARSSASEDASASKSIASESLPEQNLVSALHADKPLNVMGNGKIALLRDPQMGGTLLLSFDPANGMVHEYGATNPLSLIYLRSHEFPEAIRSLGQPALSETSIDTLGAPFASFRMIRAGKQPMTLSVLRLREVLAIRRTALLDQWNSKALGDSWTNQLLFLGSLSLLIDRLDQAYLDPNANIELLQNDPEVSKILSQVSESEFYSWAKESKVFSDAEIDSMRTQARLEKFKGRKALFTGTLILGLIGLYKVKASPTVQENPLMHAFAYTWSFCEKALIATGRTPEQIAAFRSWAAAKQLRFRGRLLKNAELNRHPVHLIKTLEKDITGYAKKTDQMPKAANGGKLFDRKKSIDERSAAILESWEEITQAAPASTAASSSSGASSGLMSKIFSWNSPAKKEAAISGRVEQLSVLQKDLEASKALDALKVRILVTLETRRALKAGTSPRDIRELSTTDEAKAFLKTRDEAAIRAKAAEAANAVPEIESSLVKMSTDSRLSAEARAEAASRLQKVKSTIGPRRVTQFTTQADQIIQDASASAKAKSALPDDGKAGQFAYMWAKVATAYSNFFLPASVRKTLLLESNFAKGYIKSDYIKTGVDQNGKAIYEQIPIEAVNAKDALKFGTFDTIGDVATQYMARQGSTDPNERMWGTGDNFVSIVNWNGKGYGPHFDLIGSEISLLWGWYMAMPQTYANMSKASSSKGAITYFDRELNSLKKSAISFVVRSGIENKAIWGFTNGIALNHYKSAHQITDCESDRGCSEFKHKLDGRVSSLGAMLERFSLSTAIGRLSISPQFYIFGEVSRASGVLFGSELIKDLWGIFVMPVVTGWGISRWFGMYFGFNNPDMIEVMRAFNIEGILSKIDQKGYADLASWTDEEKLGFIQMITLLEMQKHSEEKPLPENATPEQSAQWMTEVFAKLFPQNGPRPVDKSGSLRLQIFPPDYKKNPSKGEYDKQAAALRGMLTEMKKTLTALPLTNERKADFAVQVLDPSELTAELGETAEKLELLRLQSLMADVTRLNSTLAIAIQRLQNNSDSMERLDRSALILSTLDTIMLGDFMFTGGTAFGLLNTKWAAAYSATARKLLRTAGTVGGTASLPFNFWLGDQSNAQLKNARANGALLKELQSLLLAATEELTIRYAELNLRNKNLSELKNGFAKLRESLDVNKKKLESFLVETQKESDSLLSDHIYRVSKIGAEYGPIGMGIFGSWMLTRQFLFKASQGVILKMTDTYAPTMFKASALMWLYFAPTEKRLEREIALTTEDFFVLYQSYYSTLIQIELLRQAEAAVQSGQELPADLAQSVRKATDSDAVAKSMEDYRGKLLKLLD